MKSSPDAEPELIRRATAGDRAAFRQLVERRTDPLFRSAVAMCRDQHLAEDITQETLVEAWRSLRRFDGRCRFSTWLFGILRHRFLKAAGRHRRETSITLDDPLLVQTPQADRAPVAVAESSEDADRIRTAVATLPRDHRQVIELRFFAGASLDEIATIVDCPLGTVKSRLHHGLEKLRTMKLSMNLFHAAGESGARKP